MSYVTIRASSPARGVIYEKDYNAEVIFGPYVKVKVSQLVGLGFLREGDEYWASIIPGYGDRTVYDDMIWEVPREPVPKTGKGWLWIRTDEMLQSSPMKYFTLELHPLRTDACWYKKSFPIGELEYRSKQEKETLIALGGIDKDEEVTLEYLAAPGDVMRSGEILQMKEDLADLDSGLVVLPFTADVQFREKVMPVCNCGHSGQDRGQTLQVFFRQPDLQRLRQYITTHGSRAVESGGILIGEVYREPGAQRLYVEVEDFIPAEGTAADLVSLRFTHETWQTLIERKRGRFPEAKLVVGWYHTHPPIPITVRGKRMETVGYFSRDDENVQKRFFSEPWQIAVVLDAGSDEYVVFRWQDTSIVESESHLFDAGSESLTVETRSHV